MSWPQSPAMVGAGAQGVATAHSPVQSPEDGGLENAQDAAGTTLVRTAAAILPTWPATPVLSQIRLGQVQLAAERISQLRPSASSAPRATPILWEHSTRVHVTMESQPDVFGTPKPGRGDYAKRLRGKASRLLIVGRLRTNTVRVSSCRASEPLLGSSWTPVKPISPNPAFEHALCAWWNSTPGILTLLNSRSRTLDYARFSLSSLRSLLVPNPACVDVTPLVDAFADTRGSVLAPWPQMRDCPTRAIIDEAAARVLRIDGRTIAEWRSRIACKPTVSRVRYGMTA